MVDKNKMMNQYFFQLYKIKKMMINKDYKSKDLIWIEQYTITEKRGFNIENLPNLLALIHPDFYYSKGKYLGDSLNWKRNKSFSSDITETNHCMWKRYTDYSCIFNEDRYIREKCQADHIWPNYLGGPSIKENRLILCKFHNGMKGSDISNYTWDLFPEWLVDYLKKIYNLKL